MNLRVIANVLRKRRQLRHHERWSPTELATHQTSALAALRAHAVERSPFYAELHRGRESAPLEALPVVTKAMLMERFDDVVTDRAVKHADVLSFLETDDGSKLFHDPYWVTATSGSTGRRGIFLADESIAAIPRSVRWPSIPPR